MIGAGQDGQVFIRAESAPPAKTWQPWTKVVFTGDPFDDLRSVTAATNGDGRVLVIAVDLAGRLFSATEAAPNSDSFPDRFTPITSTLTATEVTLARNTDGRLHSYHRFSSRGALGRI